MTGTTDTHAIVEFLTARLDEAEAVARAASPGPWRWDENFGPANDDGLALTNAAGAEVVGAYNDHCCSFRTDPTVSDANMAFIAANDPAFVLADIASKRKIVKQYVDARQLVERLRGNPRRGGKTWAMAVAALLHQMLCLLAEPFSGHPDYQQEWKP